MLGVTPYLTRPIYLYTLGSIPRRLWEFSLSMIGPTAECRIALHHRSAMPC